MGIPFEEVLGYIKDNPRYKDLVLKHEGTKKPGKDDPLFQQALRIAIQNPGCTSVMIAQKLHVGYGRAAAMIDAIHKEGIKY